MRRAACAAAWLLLGCAGAEVAAPPAPAAPIVRPSAVPSASVAPAAAAALDARAAPQPADAPVAAPFPPADFAPPFPRSAQAGDGHWQRLGEASRGERIAVDPPVMLKAVIHPHEVSKFVTVTLVAIDLDRVRLHYVPGTEDVADVGAKAADLEVVPGLVPAADRDRLLAVYNGGFKPRHGRWGMMVASRVLVPPRDTGCTVALYGDGGVRIRSWSVLAPTAPDMVAYRQAPPCLLEQGALHPDLLAHNDRAWAGKDPKLKTRRRSALGLDATGRVLLFGMGEEAEPRELGLALQAAGARDATQLDINWSWTRFLIFGQSRPEAELQVTSTLIPQMVHEATGYVAKPQGRDFFYLTRSGP